MSSQQVEFSRQGSLAIITLNRPEKKNAVNNEMWVALRETFTAAEADDAVVCVLLTGAGDNFFQLTTNGKRPRTVVHSFLPGEGILSLHHD